MIISSEKFDKSGIKDYLWSILEFNIIPNVDCVWISIDIDTIGAHKITWNQ